MQALKTAIVVASLAALAGCASWQQDSSVASSKYDTSPICPKSHGWLAWNDVRCNPPEAPKATGPDLAAELAAAQKQNSALSRRVSDLEREVADSNGRLPRFILLTAVCNNSSRRRWRWPRVSKLVQAIRTGARLNWPRPGSGMRNLNPN